MSFGLFLGVGVDGEVVVMKELGAEVMCQELGMDEMKDEIGGELGLGDIDVIA